MKGEIKRDGNSGIPRKSIQEIEKENSEKMDIKMMMKLIFKMNFVSTFMLKYIGNYDWQPS